jgi:hypothetical protein
MMTERRKAPRLRTFLGGHVVFNQRYSTLDCMVRNLSADGAQLQFSDSIALPSAFDLDIAKHQRSYTARIRWRDGERIGVAFADQPSVAEVVPLDLARRLKHCEQDNARLRARIAQLTEAG